jgi:outer membrane murein-binding lipoprotein Lpp
MPWLLLSFGVLAAVMLGGKVLSGVVETADKNGVVQSDPEAIARMHGVSLDVEALARMAVKEAGSGEKPQIAVMWATRNMARASGTSVAKLLLRGRTKTGGPSSSDGKFGAQNTGKYASTVLPSTPASRDRAAKVMAGTIPDPTGGAIQFDAPSAQDKLKAAGTAGYEKSAEEIAAERSASKVSVMVPGVSSIRFWVPKGSGVA